MRSISPGFTSNRQQNAEEQRDITITDGRAIVSMPAESFITVIFSNTQKN